MHVGSARYGPAQLPPWPTISVSVFFSFVRVRISVFDVLKCFFH